MSHLDDTRANREGSMHCIFFVSLSLAFSWNPKDLLTRAFVLVLAVWCAALLAVAAVVPCASSAAAAAAATPLSNPLALAKSRLWAKHNAREAADRRTHGRTDGRS
jgi:uncharacterized membrane protein YjjB (DUF3815 family)